MLLSFASCADEPGGAEPHLDPPAIPNGINNKSSILLAVAKLYVLLFPVLSNDYRL